MAWDVMFPDFTCLNKRTGKTYYWEHFGMMDEPAYCRAFLDRIQNYGAMGIFPGTELLMTFESKQAALRPTYVDELIENFLL